MRFDWTPRKSEWNQRERGFDFEVASRIFADVNVLDVKGRIENGEQQWQAIGPVPGLGIILELVSKMVL
ncbi:MAG: BrnT family toxin [Candidatus Korobacteraceae bacterium]|jgi:uncharacterized DUF497 family protein